MTPDADYSRDDPTLDRGETWICSECGQAGSHHPTCPESPDPLAMSDTDLREYADQLSRSELIDLLIEVRGAPG